MELSATVRPALAEDSRACFDVFRRSLWDLRRRTGHLPADAPDPDLDAQWRVYRSLFAHLAGASAEWWMAEDATGRPVGYARSVESDGLLELTEFFVAADARVAGVGRALLDRAFPAGRGTHRSIIATLDAPAVALYLRAGVMHQSTAVGLVGTPRPVPPPPGYEAVAATAAEVLRIERAVLGHAREREIAFMLADRPGVVLRRRGEAVAYALGPNGDGYAGPVAALDPADLPAALAVLETAAHDARLQALDFTVPLAARSAVDWLVGQRRFRIDPFYCLLLADGPWARLDRYLPFNPCLLL